MAKKKTADTPTTPPATRRPRTTTARTSKPAAAPVDIAGVSKMEPIAAAADNGDLSPKHDEIAVAAYHRYLRRGPQDGSEFDDWVEAERELRDTKR